MHRIASRIAREKDESIFLEVQAGINIHYKVYKAINTFRKPQKRAGGAGVNQVRRSASSNKEPAETQQKQNLIRLSDATTRNLTLVSEQIAESEAECELDVPDGMEELGDRPPNSAPIQLPKTNDIHEENKQIIFVLLHSYLGCTEQWDKVAISLRQYGTVISFDR